TQDVVVCRARAGHRLGSVLCKPNDFSVFTTQALVPNGGPRFAQRRMAASLAPVCAAFTHAAQARGTGRTRASLRHWHTLWAAHLDLHFLGRVLSIRVFLIRLMGSGGELPPKSSDVVT